MSYPQKKYSLSEISRITGVDEKKVNIYAQEDLIGLMLSNKEVTFCEIDFARLNIIKRAMELGYHHEEIKHLIGSAHDLIGNNDPLISCKNDAIRKYKKIQEELDQCEPLDQIKRQCDLKLISNYIQQLNAVQPHTLIEGRAGNRGPQARLRPVQDIVRKLPNFIDKDSTLAPPVPPPQSGDVAHSERRGISSFIFFKPFWIFAIIATGIVVAILISLLTFSSDIKKLESRTAPEPSPPLQSPKNEPSLRSKKSNEEGWQRPVETHSREAKTMAPQKRTVVGKIPPMSASTPETNQGKVNTLKPELIVEAKTISSTATGYGNLTTTDEPSASIVAVEEFFLKHDNPNKIYRAEFNIVKNQTIGGSQAVSGCVFLKLQVGASPPFDKSLIIPDVAFSSGKPRWLPRSGQFIINNYKPMVLETRSSITPDQISSIQVLVYSSDFELLFEKFLPLIIQPYASASEQRPRGDNINDSISARKMPIEPVPPEVSPSSGAASDSGKSDHKVLETDENLPVKPRKTDNPQAVLWEQRSYDAAVQGYFDRAISDATKAIELDPGRANPYINRSWAYIKKGMPEKAINDGITALSIDPENPYALNNLGLAYQRRSELAKAKDYYQKACRLGLETGCENMKMLGDQSRLQKLIDQSQTAFNNGDWQNVIRAATEAIELDPQNAVALTNRSAAHAQLNSLNQALKDANDAITSDPQFALAYNNRGYVYQLMGNNENAAADYLKSCSMGLALGCQNFERFSNSP